MHLEDWIAALARQVAAGLHREPPPEVLWQRFRAEDDKYAAVVLIALHGRPVWNYCRAYLSDYQSAEEVFQDTFCELYRRRARIPDYRSVRRWLLRTARNKVRDAWKRLRRQRRTASHPLVEDVAGPAGIASDQSVEGREQVLQALRTLPEKYGRPLELVYLQGLTHAEAAEVLRVPTGTLSSLVSRGLLKLRSRLSTTAGVGVGLVTIEAVLALPVEVMPSSLIDSTARVLTAAPAGIDRLPGMAAWLTWNKGLSSLAALTGVAIALGLLTAPSPRNANIPPPAPPAPIDKKPLAQRNRELLERDVIPKVLQELGTIPGAGEVKLVSLDAYDTRVECVIEGPVVQVLNPTVQVPRMRLLYDTHDGWKELWMKFHADGRWTRMDPPDRPRAVLVLIPWAGWRELEFPVPQFDRAWAAFAIIPPDDRMPREASARDDAVLDVARGWVGTWVAREKGNHPRWIRWDRRLGLVFSASGWNAEYSLGGLDWSPNNPDSWRRIVAGENVFTVSTDGSRIDLDIPKTVDHETWFRAEVISAGEARPPIPGRDLTGIWVPGPPVKGHCAILHCRDGRIVLVNATDARTYGAVNTRGDLWSGESGEWSPAMRGTVERDFNRITWTNPDGSPSAWVRNSETTGLSGIWHRAGAQDRLNQACAVIERDNDGSRKSVLLIDEWGRRTRATCVDGIVIVKSGPEWGRTRGTVSADCRRIEWESGVAWVR
jgi:RNA polymerase sigma-70 factor, ECF subfamily